MINSKDLKLEEGQKVYWIDNMEGVVVKYNALMGGPYPYGVEFESGETLWFTADGYASRYNKRNQFPLSFTPYTVNLKGYSNTPPLPKLDKNKVVYVRNCYTHTWSMRFPSHFNERGVLECFASQMKEGGTTPWEQFSFTNPLEEK